MNHNFSSPFHTPLQFFLTSFLLFIFSTHAFQVDAQHSAAREWNEALLFAIRKDFARPTVHARNLFHASIVMYDAWAVYDDQAQPYFLGDTLNGFSCPFTGVSTPSDIAAAQEEAVSYAAYRLLQHRFQNSPGGTASLALFDSLFVAMGYDPTNFNMNYANSPAELGNYIADCMIGFGFQDGSNEINDYGNIHYSPTNPTLLPMLPGNPAISDPNLWQPLTLNVFIDQSGNVFPINTPLFLSPEWGQVPAFAIPDSNRSQYFRDGNSYWVSHDPGSSPLMDTTNAAGDTEAYQWGFSLVAAWSSHLDPADSVMWDISPASIGNIQDYPAEIDSLPTFYNFTEGGDYGTGHTLNPHTGQPYTPQVVPRADYARVLAEFWADGPDSETPPGHWFTLLNYVNDHPQFEKRWEGDGPVLAPLEWDVKAYLSMGGAVHDAAITAWGIKGWYDYIRPISAIRYMADQGQSSDTALANYSPLGLPLIMGLIEVVDSADTLSGPMDEHVGKLKINCWKGPDYINNPASDMAGVDWILAENWWPYQRPSFVTPPFAGYISGHSTFSRAAAEVMTHLTGDPFFPGGMGEFIAPQDDFLVFEEGPSQDIVLQWATYRDASDQCSLSRIWGGIHPPADDIPGRLIGITIGNDAFAHAESYFDPNGQTDVASISPSILIIASQDTGIAHFGLTVVFDNSMDTSSVPSLIFPVEDPTINSLVFNPDSSSWLSPYTYEARYDVLYSGELLDSIDVRVAGALNTEGQAQAAFDARDQFTIEMQAPSVDMLIPNRTMLADGNTGPAAFRFQVRFDEEMDMLVAPQVSFPGTNPLLQSFLIRPDSTRWQDPQTYVIVYDLLDADETLPKIDIVVESAKDVYGNLQTPYFGTNELSIDTQNPDLLSLVAGTDTIQYADIGMGTFDLTLSFSEKINPAVHPLITFPAENPLACCLVENTGASGWVSDSIYLATYDVLDTISSLLDIDIHIAGSITDLIGNSFSPQSETDVFHINIQADSSTLSIEPSSGELISHIYPNPIKRGEELQLEFEATSKPLKLTVFDAIGKQVRSQILKGNAGDRKESLSTSALSPGLYLLSIQLEKGLLTGRFWVQP